MIVLSVALAERINFIEGILSFAEKYGIELENERELKIALAELEWNKDRLALELTYQQLVLYQEVLGISNETLAVWRGWLDELQGADVDFGAIADGSGTGM